MAVIDLSQLPAPDVVETLDFEAISPSASDADSLYPDEQEAIAGDADESESTGEISGRMPTGVICQRINEAAKRAWWPTP